MYVHVTYESGGSRAVHIKYGHCWISSWMCIINFPEIWFTVVLWKVFLHTWRTSMNSDGGDPIKQWTVRCHRCRSATEPVSLLMCYCSLCFTVTRGEADGWLLDIYMYINSPKSVVTCISVHFWWCWWITVAFSCQAIGTAEESACHEELLCCVGEKRNLSAHFSVNWIIVW
jgi:hypothetical protein